jgi:hypothetical protein
MGSVSVFLIGGTSLTNVSEASGTYWHISLVGGGKVDLSKAVFPQDKPVCVNTITLFGGSRILVPRGTRVEVGGFHVMGGNRSNVSPAEKEVHNHLKAKIFCIFGGINVSAKEAS